MTPQQIGAVLANTEQILRVVIALPEYQRLQQPRFFTTSNDLTLADAIQALVEVQDAIATVQEIEGGSNELSL